MMAHDNPTAAENHELSQQRPATETAPAGVLDHVARMRESLVAMGVTFLVSELDLVHQSIIASVASREALRACLQECADDLECEIEARRSGDVARRIERDLAPVRRARELLAAASVGETAIASRDVLPELHPAVFHHPKSGAGLYDTFSVHQYAVRFSDTQAAPLLDELRLCRERVTELEQELQQAKEFAADAAAGGSKLVDLAVKNGGLSMQIEGGAARLLAEMLAKQYEDSAAANYFEMSFTSSHVKPGEAFVVTVQRVAGKTPHMLRAEAEAERDALRPNAQRWVFWRPRVICADFEYEHDERVCSVVAFEIPDGMPVSGDIDKTTDAAINAAQHAQATATTGDISGAEVLS